MQFKHSPRQSISKTEQIPTIMNIRIEKNKNKHTYIDTTYIFGRKQKQRNEKKRRANAHNHIIKPAFVSRNYKSTHYLNYTSLNKKNFSVISLNMLNSNDSRLLIHRLLGLLLLLYESAFCQ
uniref:(northern house mosquito) hypothetical protein n=1 Tax=Culex pipiens TaxID=7175 RepID=A0A8D8CZ55_CULPI